MSISQDIFSLSGRVALVTGGSRGIGRAIAVGLAKFGADVAVTSRKLADLEEVAKEIKGLGRKSMAVATHVGRVEEIRNLVPNIDIKKIWIFVNRLSKSLSTLITSAPLQS